MVKDVGCASTGHEVNGYVWMVVAVDVLIGRIVNGWVALLPLFWLVFRVSFGARDDVSPVAEDGDSGTRL